MLILECSHGCYGRTDGRTEGRKEGRKDGRRDNSITISLRNFTGEGITTSSMRYRVMPGVILSYTNIKTTSSMGYRVMLGVILSTNQSATSLPHLCFHILFSSNLQSLHIILRDWMYWYSSFIIYYFILGE